MKTGQKIFTEAMMPDVVEMVKVIGSNWQHYVKTVFLDAFRCLLLLLDFRGLDSHFMWVATID